MDLFGSVCLFVFSTTIDGSGGERERERGQCGIWCPGMRNALLTAGIHNAMHYWQCAIYNVQCVMCMRNAQCIIDCRHPQCNAMQSTVHIGNVQCNAMCNVQCIIDCRHPQCNAINSTLLAMCNVQCWLPHSQSGSPTASSNVASWLGTWLPHSLSGSPTHLPLEVGDLTITPHSTDQAQPNQF